MILLYQMNLSGKPKAYSYKGPNCWLDTGPKKTLKSGRLKLNNRILFCLFILTPPHRSYFSIITVIVIEKKQPFVYNEREMKDVNQWFPPVNL
ncbi:hypothetical protein BH745_13820 [Enterococcus gallinarum]|nr:hypothetical protein BH745_13820 [Enterococcus gallinarum]